MHFWLSGEDAVWNALTPCQSAGVQVSAVLLTQLHANVHPKRGHGPGPQVPATHLADPH